MGTRTSSSLQPDVASQLHQLLRQTEFGGEAGPADMTDDAQRMAEDRRRNQLQRTRLVLNEQERRLSEELMELRRRRAGLLQEHQPRMPFVPGGGTPLESYRRATGRTALSDNLRGRGPHRMLQYVGRSGSGKLLV